MARHGTGPGGVKVKDMAKCPKFKGVCKRRRKPKKQKVYKANIKKRGKFKPSKPDTPEKKKEEEKGRHQEVRTLGGIRHVPIR